MSTPYKRKKQPEKVRNKLIECAARIAAEQGPGGLTIQAVADAAGVTKGGLLHHFRDKKQLIESVFGDFLNKLDNEIDHLLAEDPVAYGRFTRAYIMVALKNVAPRSKADMWKAFSLCALTEPQFHNLWNDWIHARLAVHHETDHDPALHIARYAFDGAWSANLMGAISSEEYFALLDRLVDMTKP